MEQTRKGSTFSSSGLKNLSFPKQTGTTQQAPLKQRYGATENKWRNQQQSTDVGTSAAYKPPKPQNTNPTIQNQAPREVTKQQKKQLPRKQTIGVADITEIGIDEHVIPSSTGPGRRIYEQTTDHSSDPIKTTAQIHRKDTNKGDNVSQATEKTVQNSETVELTGENVLLTSEHSDQTSQADTDTGEGALRTPKEQTETDDTLPTSEKERTEQDHQRNSEADETSELTSEPTVKDSKQATVEDDEDTTGSITDLSLIHI